MIPFDKLRAVTHLVTHANCPDGVASALIVKDALPDVRVNFVKYNSEEHRNLEPAPGMLFCDFSPYVVRSKEANDVEYLDGNAMARWVNAGAIVLDHHTRDIVENFALNGLGVFGENERLECGAWLAYEHVWKHLGCGHKDEIIAERVRNFAELAAVRDTWRQDDKRFKRAREEGELLLFWGMKQPLEYYLGLSEGGRGMLAERLFERAEEHARTSITESVRFTSAKGTRVLMFQGVAATSDAAELVEKEGYEITKTDATGSVERGRGFGVDLVVGFHYRAETPPPDTRPRTLTDRIVEGPEATIANRAFPPPRLQLQFSTRSQAGYDCQALARAHGGNGHKAAAGFTLSEGLIGNPYETFKNLLDWWERGR